jgi:hypothetical protein
MGLKSIMNFKIGKTKGKPDSTDEAHHVLATKIAILEEQVSGKTRELAEAEQQIKKLAASASGTEEDTAPQPHGPLVELEIEAGGESAEEDNDAGILLEEAEEETEGVKTKEVKAAEVKAPEAKAAIEETGEVKLTEAKATEVKTAAEATEAVKPAEAKAADTAPATPADTTAASATAGSKEDDLSQLFSQDEEEENPLAALINALPDVSAQELLDDLQEIKMIIRESQHK